MPRRTALIVPVPEASAFYDGPAGVPGHVTILFPFADDEAVDERALDELFGERDAFEFTLDRIEQFDDGTAWLAPEPSAPLRALIDAVWARWPEYPPYEGTIADPTPHVTITRLDVPLPIRCRADETWLLVEQPDGSFTRRRAFALGQGVA
jgi:2'-5' RNA ligase